MMAKGGVVTDEDNNGDAELGSSWRRKHCCTGRAKMTAQIKDS
jgi:hypothetical protein